MSEWKEYKLGDIIEIVGGGTPKTSVSDYWNGEIPWLSVVDFNNDQKYVYETEKQISFDGLNNSSTKILNKGDIIISARGTVGAMAMIGKEMAFNQSCYGIKARDIVDNHYLYYLLRTSIQELKHNAHGGVFDTITRETFDMISNSLPPLDEQKRIAGVLSSLDDKIDLLHRENATLETLAETLFRHYFIENPNPEWKEGKLTDFIKIIGGGTPKTNEPSYWNGDIGWLSGGDISGNHKNYILNVEKYITQKGVDNSSVHILPENSMIISARGTVGKYCLIGRPMAFSQSNYGILPKINGCYFFTYLLVSRYVEEMKNAAYGSVFDTITTKTFESIDVFLPSEKEVIVVFDNQVKPIFEKLKRNQLQIQSMLSQRDTLLPRLMNGEVKVGE